MPHSRRQSRPPPKNPLPARPFVSALSCSPFLFALLLLYADNLNNNLYEYRLLQVIFTNHEHIYTKKRAEALFLVFMDGFYLE